MSAYAPEVVWEAFRRSATRNVQEAFCSLDPSTIARVTDRIRTRDGLYIAAAHESHGIVRYLHTLASLVSPNVHLVGPDGSIDFDDLADVGPRDALLCLCPGLPCQPLHTAAGLARERGALIVGITGSRRTALAALCDHVLPVPLLGPSFFPSHVAALAVAETLVGFLVSGVEPSAAERIERVRAIRRRLQAPAAGDSAVNKPRDDG